MGDPAAYGSPVLFIVLGTGVERGKVLRLVVISTDATYTCIAHGHVVFD